MCIQNGSIDIFRYKVEHIRPSHVTRLYTETSVAESNDPRRLAVTNAERGCSV